MKGIILAGGKGTRLHPLTLVTHKDLLPIYDVPMIYYPLEVLISNKINDILIITTKEYLKKYEELLGDGSDRGVKIKYVYEPECKGTAQSIILAREFIANDQVCLIYGDNIFLGNLKEEFEIGKKNLKQNNSSIFAYRVKKREAKNYGVIEVGRKDKIISIEEKPIKPKSRYICTGLYFYTNEVVALVDKIKPSIRGELEITDINKLYLEENRLNIIKINRKTKWLDAGTKDNLLKASELAKKYK